MTRIRIHSGATAVIAELDDTPTARRLLAALPCDSHANTWGDEVYFSVPISAALEADAQQVVEPGTVGFWVEGNSLAIPFGPTPISRGGECRLAARVNVLGKILGDPRALAAVCAGDAIHVEAVEE